MLKKLPDLLKFLPLLAIAAGCILVSCYLIRHIPELSKSWMIKAEHPSNYRFTVYDELLKKYIKDGLVDYKNLCADPRLKTAVDDLEKVAPDKMDRKEQLCFWINAFNLLTLKTICDRYPARSTFDLSSDLSQRKFIVGGEVLGLQQIQDRYILPLTRNPAVRVETIFLISRGSQGYPPLTDHAITPDTMEDDARMAAYKFINDDRNAFYDDETLTFYLSPLFKQYESIIDDKVHKSVHHFAVLYMVTKKPVKVDALMVTKTYFGKMDYTLNDTALAPIDEKKKSEEENKATSAAKTSAESTKQKEEVK